MTELPSSAFVSLHPITHPTAANVNTIAAVETHFIKRLFQKPIPSRVAKIMFQNVFYGFEKTCYEIFLKQIFQKTL